jgi:hypothetical protein
MFRSDDLPTFDRPIKANSGSDSSGQELESAALQKNVADEIFTLINARLIVAQIEPAETYIVRKMPRKRAELGNNQARFSANSRAAGGPVQSCLLFSGMSQQ